MHQIVCLRRMLPLLAVLLLASSLATAQAANPPQPAAPQDVPGNVVPNGGFEQQGQGWQTCGGTTYADVQANLPFTPLRVHSGRYAAQFTNPTIEQGPRACPQGGYESPTQLIRVPVQIPADAQVLTVSFWYSVTGPEGTGDISVFFSDQPDYIISSYGSRLDDLKSDENVGWYEFRQVLSGKELINARTTKDDFFAGRPPSGNTYFNIRLRRSLNTEQVLSVFIDDVAITFTDRSLQPAPLPAALKSDGTQPIVYSHYNSDNKDFTVYRMDTDGQRAQEIYRTRLLGVNRPRWSPDGTWIAVIEKDLQGFSATDPTVNPAIVNELTILDANGAPLAAPARALGKPGVAGSPPGCSPIGGTFCSRPEDDAIDSSIYNVDWSPASDALVIELGFHSRSSTGASSDDIGSLLLINDQTPFVVSGADDGLKINDGGAEPSWGANNVILFNEAATGVFKDTPEIKLDNAVNVVSRPNTLLGRRIAFPTWSRDATKFVTVNKVAGGDTFYGNYALVLHDANTNELTRALVTIDYPSSITGKPSWSPDGNYVLFTVQSPTEDSNLVMLNVWWVDVATGAAGQVTTDGQSFQPDWRPRGGAGVPVGQQPGGGTGVTVAQGFPGTSTNPTPGAFRVFLPTIRQR